MEQGSPKGKRLPSGKFPGLHPSLLHTGSCTAHSGSGRHCTHNPLTGARGKGAQAPGYLSQPGTYSFDRAVTGRKEVVEEETQTEPGPRGEGT